ncbi:hypothetical protein BOW50_05600 [Solemya velum gill symbiont]|nr:hypothetical protein BOW50_05600 [Solemya velum gill symbiont]
MVVLWAVRDGFRLKPGMTVFGTDENSMSFDSKKMISALIARFVGGFAFHKNHGDRDSCSQKLHKDFIVARYFLVDLPQFIEKHLFGKN